MNTEELKDKREIEEEAEKDQKAGRRPFFTEWLEKSKAVSDNRTFGDYEQASRMARHCDLGA